MRGICKLTKKEDELQNSHIYPKFVIDWYKETGGKYIRGSQNPNVRLQSGYKKYMLSFEAEQLFSLREKWFAENIFHKYLKNAWSPLNYNEHLFYFAISFLWRILVLELELPNIKQFKFYNTLIEVEEKWRLFLYKGIYPQKYDRLHLMLTDRIKYHDVPLKGVDYFFSRSLDGTVIYNTQNNFLGVYAKFSRFIFWAYVFEGDESLLKGTKINSNNGIIKIPQIIAEPEIMGFFMHRIEELSKLKLASENQQSIISQEIKSNPTFYNESEAIQTILKDLDFDRMNNA